MSKMDPSMLALAHISCGKVMMGCTGQGEVVHHRRVSGWVIVSNT